MFRAKHRHKVYVPHPRISGRIGGVRMVSSAYDVAFFCCYFPPRCMLAQQMESYQKTVDMICGELDNWISELQRRCTPMIGLDLNDGLKAWSDGTCSVGEEIVGEKRYAADKFHHLLVKHHMAAVNTIIGPRQHTCWTETRVNDRLFVRTSGKVTPSRKLQHVKSDCT